MRSSVNFNGEKMSYGQSKSGKKISIDRAFARRFYPQIKSEVFPGVDCPECKIRGAVYILEPGTDDYLCYWCGYRLPERFEKPL